MASIDTDTTNSPPPARSRRRRWAWITIATVGLLSASALLAIPAIADGSDPPSPPSYDRTIVCYGDVETDGDVQISAATVTRVALGDTTPVPEGCREG
jgi:hypothetical protein